MFMTNPVTAFKSLAPNEYTITPFPAYASFQYTYTSGSTNNSDDVNILRAVEYTSTPAARITPNVEHDLFNSVIQSFYSPLVYSSYGIQSSSYKPTGSTFIVSVTQNVFGEEIVPGSFSISVGTSSSYDDQHGNLIVSQSGTGSILGRIFYDKGIVVIKPTSSISGGGLTKDGICIVSGTNVTVNFTSSMMLYEHSVKVRLNPTDFNFSLYNPTVQKTFYTGSTSTPLTSMISRSLYPQDTTYLAPYVSSIGLYNAQNELIAIAKVSNPIQRTFDSTQTFVIKFDT